VWLLRLYRKFPCKMCLTLSKKFFNEILLIFIKGLIREDECLVELARIEDGEKFVPIYCKKHVR